MLGFNVCVLEFDVRVLGFDVRTIQAALQARAFTWIKL